MTVTEQLKELLQIAKNNKGQLLSLAKRVKALEENEKDGIQDFAGDDQKLLYSIGEYLGFIGKLGTPITLDEPEEEIEEAVEEDEEIPEEALEELEELINGDS